MRKAYIQPEAELLSLKSLDDFLALSSDNPLDPDDNEEGEDNGMGESSGNITDERPGIW